MFFSKYKNDVIDKSNALVGRDNPVIDKLSHEINGRDLMHVPKGFCEIVLGMGCFWGAEKIFWNLQGVYHTSVGYAGGHTKNPTYEEVCSGLTGHTEVVRVVYDPSKISIKKVLIYFWEGHDPTQGMRQGNDIGTQYRSGIYTFSDEDLVTANKSKALYQERLNKSRFGIITTEIKRASKFYFAEEYHQQYLIKNPNGYCALKGTGIEM